jgi:hypothetical protein
VLITIDDKGLAVARRIEGSRLAAPVRQLTASAGAEPDVAWRDFVATLLAR